MAHLYPYATVVHAFYYMSIELLRQLIFSF
jgi:hypothetical protein